MYYILLLLLLSSCASPTLLVQSEYLTPDRYASIWVDTPDPNKYLWRLSQRLLIEWNLPKSLKGSEARIELVLNMRNYEVIHDTLLVKRPKGCFAYHIDESCFCETGGFFAYRVRLFSGDCLIAESCHHLYEEIMTLDKESCE